MAADITELSKAKESPCYNMAHNDFSSDFAEAVQTANRLLLYRKFDECLNLCIQTISLAKCHLEKKGSAETIESLSLLAVQAYAELNRWQEVLPFVTQLYEGIEDCPSRLVEICILLHAHMHDFTTCNAISHIWLRNPDNSTCPNYNRVVEIFLTKVLEPQDHLADAAAFLDSCPGLSHAQRTVYIRYAEIKTKTGTDVGGKDSKTSHNKDKGGSVVSKTSPKADGESQQSLIQRLVQKLSSYIPTKSQRIIKRMVLVAIFFYWIFTKANFDFLSNQRLLGFFSALLRLWRSMFAPYHLAK